MAVILRYILLSESDYSFIVHFYSSNLENAMLQFEMPLVIETFNKKWEKGIEILKHAGMGPRETAEFLMKNKNELNFKQLGECLSDEKQKDLMREYVHMMNFKGVGFVPALRAILTEFEFPGEAQKIDRIMEAFGSEYFEANKDQLHFEFANADAAYTLAFSCVMLNSDAHNKAIAKSKKMSLEQFISNNRGMNNKANFSSPFLEAIYKDITRNEIKIPSKKAQVESDLDSWVKGQGQYRFGFATRHYILGEGLQKEKEELSRERKERHAEEQEKHLVAKLQAAIEPSEPVDKAKVQKEELSDYDKWVKGQAGYQLGYYTMYYLLGKKPSTESALQPSIKSKPAGFDQ